MNVRARGAPASSFRSLLPNLGGLWLFIILIAGMAALPTFVSTYTVLLVVPIIGYGVALLGFNLLFGYTGMLSFGHALFLAIGGYTVAAMTSRLGMLNFEMILVVAVALSVLIAIPVGALCVRYSGIFFAFLTLAFSMLFYSFLFKFYYITGGNQGMSVSRPLLLGREFDVGQTAFLTGPFYYYALVVFAVLGIVMWRIVESPFGLHMRAVRENPDKAAYVGVNVYRVRFAAFIISAIYGAIGGAVLSTTVGLASPELAIWTHSGKLVFMTVLGGSGFLAGPVIGAFIFAFLQNSVMTVTGYWRFLMGAILVILVLFAPGGITGIVNKLVARWRPGRR